MHSTPHPPAPLPPRRARGEVNSDLNRSTASHTTRALYLTEGDSGFKVGMAFFPTAVAAG